MVSVSRSDKNQLFGSLSCKAANDVAVDMTYNMGKSGMATFQKFIGSMKSGDYLNAAVEGENSLWCRQVKSRCSRDMSQLRQFC